MSELPDNALKVSTSLDAKPRTLFAKRDAASQHSFPIIASTNGSLVIAQEDFLYQNRWDADGRSDFQAVYAGYAPRGVTASSEGWLLFKYTYDGDGFCTLKQTAYASWDNRASASYA